MRVFMDVRRGRSGENSAGTSVSVHSFYHAGHSASVPGSVYQSTTHTRVHLCSQSHNPLLNVSRGRATRGRGVNSWVSSGPFPQVYKIKHWLSMQTAWCLITTPVERDLMKPMNRRGGRGRGLMCMCKCKWCVGTNLKSFFLQSFFPLCL